MAWSVASAAVYLCFFRAVMATDMLPLYSRAIYLQQWQMARLLQTSFPTASVAANDIGAISFKTQIECTDLVGIADRDIFTAKREGQYTTGFIRSETGLRRVQIAMVYDTWFSDHQDTFNAGPRLPAEWIRVAVMRRPREQDLGDSAVSFYAVDPTVTPRLRLALQALQSSLPPADSMSF